jgi:hypothetical protein
MTGNFTYSYVFLKNIEYAVLRADFLTYSVFNNDAFKITAFLILSSKFYREIWKIFIRWIYLIFTINTALFSLTPKQIRYKSLHFWIIDQSSMLIKAVYVLINFKS